MSGNGSHHRFYFLRLLLTGFLYLGLNSVVSADDKLGRLFTTPEQRQKLQQLRFHPPESEVVAQEPEIDIEEIMLPEEPEKPEEPKLVDVIHVKGVVYREDGKNTAWINDSNTFVGDLESQYIQVNTREIEPDQIQLTMPDKTTKIKIKVGGYYDPQEKDSN